MYTKMFRLVNKHVIVQKSGCRFNRNFVSTKSESPKPSNSSIPNVPGFTDRVVAVPNQPVGFAGASKDTEYKNPEYFCYHTDSFGDSMLELAKYRLPAPSNIAKQ